MKSLGEVAFEAWTRAAGGGWDGWTWAMEGPHCARWEAAAREVIAEDARRRGTDPVVRVIRTLRDAREKIAALPGADDDPLLAEIDSVLAGVADVR